MSAKFNTSVNIIRDSDVELAYIPTPNAKLVASQLLNDFKKGLRSFNIIGTYGTGKSSFLMAFERTVLGKQPHFNVHFGDADQMAFIKIVGSYASITEQFADYFEAHSAKDQNQHIFAAIYDYYIKLQGEQKTLFLLIDEFGKFLEYASKRNPEKELYFMQELAEFCNDTSRRIVLLTTVHQSLESYAYGLSRSQQQEWTKVKGRFREITFNEPVEQLLYLASQHLGVSNSSSVDVKATKAALKLTLDSQAFRFDSDFAASVANNLYPLDLMAATCLTLSLQRYGQNERSLFSFLESTDHTALGSFNGSNAPFYNLAKVYDYLNYNFYSFLTSKYNPDFADWSSIRNAIDEAERTYFRKLDDYLAAIKAIGLLNLYAAKGSNLDFKFISAYLLICCGIEDAENIVQELEKKNIIRFRKHAKRYILFEGTDLDIQSALVEAADKVSEIEDISGVLRKHVEFNPVFARQYSFDMGTPRYFDYIISDQPVSRIPSGEVDGFINLIFSSRFTEDEVKIISAREKEAIIYCFFKNAAEIKSLLFEIEKTQKVLLENEKDKVAVKELEGINTHQVRLLKRWITESIFNREAEVSWFFKGERYTFSDKKDFQVMLSQVCRNVYESTPAFRNELVNRHKISPSIHTAKRNYFIALANNWDKEDLGFEEDRFPPEKTIYLSLLKENGLSLLRDNAVNPISVTETSSFYALWCASEHFLNTAKRGRMKVSELVNLLCQRPFKLKQGLIDFWVPTFLFLKRDEFALFNNDGYVPDISSDILDLLAKEPSKFAIKTFDVDGVKLDIFNSYRSFLNLGSEDNFNNESFIETIKPFLVFYKQLPAYSKNTQRLSNTAKKVREAIKNSTDPEETFFMHFPEALGFSMEDLQQDGVKLQAFTSGIQDAVRELRTSYDALISRFEAFICDEYIGKEATFEVYKPILQKRFAKVKKHMLLSSQKSFVQRIDSPLDDRKAWLNSLAQSIIGKIMEQFVDEDEIKLYDGFKSTILALDGLTSLSRVDIDEENEDVVSIKIDAFLQNPEALVLRYPKVKSAEVEKLKIALKKSLGNDKTLNTAALIEMLKEVMK
jgi:hypothetical protein